MQLIIGNQNYSSWSLRPWLALKQMEVKFEEIRIPLYEPNSAAAIAQYSPSGRVPVLIDGAQTVWDSLAILEYLAERYPEQPWWPRDLAARTQARCISAEMHAGFFALREQMPMNCRARFPGQGRSPATDRDIARVRQIWSRCREQWGQGGAFLFGEFSIADAMYAPVVLRFVTYGVELNAIEQAYREAVLNLPALQDWLAAGLAETETIAQYDTLYA
ncbi:MAG: glutathione S-transferase family protein [Synechococcales cyanobacterium RU_4_20]|nr:glutathione S-transferase family protein [Synechococcales cyanobacterium RU_4_20]NJR67352.1 glutathione S-transferase family protein [Synechococcales cyanobacterium CRU_2_2]